MISTIRTIQGLVLVSLLEYKKTGDVKHILNGLEAIEKICDKVFAVK